MTLGGGVTGTERLLKAPSKGAWQRGGHFSEEGEACLEEEQTCTAQQMLPRDCTAPRTLKLGCGRSRANSFLLSPHFKLQLIGSWELTVRICPRGLLSPFSLGWLSVHWSPYSSVDVTTVTCLCVKARSCLCPVMHMLNPNL